MVWVADLSNNNDDATVDRAIADNDIIILKATEGNYMVDPCINTSNPNSALSKAIKANKNFGFYHFINGAIDVKEQAQYFLDAVAPEGMQDGVPLILDFENVKNNPAYPTLTGYEPRVFADYIKEKTGKDIMLYIGQSDVINSEHGYTWDDMKDNALWLANYPVADGADFSQQLQDWEDANVFAKLPYWKVVSMWQYDYIPYDRSIFYGDLAGWRKIGTPQSSNASTSDDSSTKESEAPKAQEPAKDSQSSNTPAPAPKQVPIPEDQHEVPSTTLAGMSFGKEEINKLKAAAEVIVEKLNKL